MLRKPPKPTKKGYQEALIEYYKDFLNPFIVDLLYGEPAYFLKCTDDIEKFNVPTGMSRMLLAVMDTVTKEIGEINFEVIHVALESATVLTVCDLPEMPTEEVLTSAVKHALEKFLKANECKYKQHKWHKFQRNFKLDTDQLFKSKKALVAAIEPEKEPSPLILPARMS